MESYHLSHLDVLEAEGIHILREVVGQFERPVLLYSAGKDSSVLLRLAQKAFAPGPIPFPLLHVDTSYKFPELYEFRDRIVEELGARLIVHRNEEAIASGAHPQRLGTLQCCALLKTQALLSALEHGGFDAAIGGARRDEEKSRAKERVFSVRDDRGQWDPKRQRPELWNLYNGLLRSGESVRVFPLSNWTESDVWHYIAREEVPIAPLYFARQREVLVGNGERKTIMCRYRTLGCSPCTGAIESSATTVAEILEELDQIDMSERANRAIDHDSYGSMEQKKQEGYF